MTFSRKGGSSLKLGEDSREFYDQLIGAIVKIEPGELPLDPAFGTADPTFTKGEPSGLRSTVAAYWPEIIIKNISLASPDQSGISALSVDYGVL